MENKATLITKLGTKEVIQEIYVLEHFNDDSGTSVRFNTTDNLIEHKIKFELADDIVFTLYEGWGDNSKVIISNEPVSEELVLSEARDFDLGELVNAINSLNKTILKSNDRIVRAIQGIDPDV